MPHSASAALMCGRLHRRAVAFQRCGLLCGRAVCFSDADNKSYSVHRKDLNPYSQGLNIENLYMMFHRNVM